MKEAQTSLSVDWLLAAMARSAADYVIVLVDLDGKILWINETGERVLGMTRTEAVGTPIDATFLPRDVDAGVPEHERRLTMAMGYAENDRWHMRADGSQFWSSGSMNQVRNEHGEVIAYAKIFRDRTDWKEQQDRLANEVDSLRRHRQQHIVAMGTLAHEMRSPLSAVFNATAVLRHLAAGHVAMSAPLGMLERQLAAIRRQVDDLVDVTRITTGKMQLEFAPVSMQEVIDLTVKTVLPDDSQRPRVQLVMPDALIKVNGDALRLQQVFSNLLNNALKFTPEDGHIALTLELVDQEAVVRLKDTGIGIRQDLLPKIFDLFTQAEEDRVRDGLGIGLALVRELVTLHGGTVQVRSDGAGKGAEFTVRLPLAL